MQSLIKILTPTPEGRPITEDAWYGLTPGQPPAEQFQAVMGRALTRAPFETPDDSNSSKEPARDKTKPGQIRKPDPSHPSKLDSSAHAENLATQAPPPSPPVAGTARAQSETSARADAVSRADQPTGSSASEPDSSPAADGSGTQTDDSAKTAASADAESKQSKAGSPDNAAAGSKPGLKDQLSATAESAAGPKGSAASITAPAGEAIPEGEAADAADAPAQTAKSPTLQPLSSGGPGATGISSAQQQVPMQKADKTNNSSALAEQNLPVSPAGNGGELPGKIARTLATPSRQDKSETSTAMGSSISSTTAPAETASLVRDSSQLSAATSMRSLERTHELMSLQSVRLRESGMDSLQVIIKPEVGLQLSLNLQMRNGNMEMHATLHRGDFDFMSRHWPELQQQLESRGVRLTSLTCSEEFAGGDNQLSQDPGRRQTDEDTTSIGAFAGVAFAGALKPSAATKSTTLRGWESWA